MKFGVLFRIQDPPSGEHIGRRMREAIRASQVAEEAGFDGVFLPEHHMMDDAYLPSPFPLLGALAATTEKIHIGTTVHLLPFYNPVQTAEASAIVDQISGGRLKLGVGLGNFEPEFELMGLEKKDQVGRFTEAIELVRKHGPARRLTSRESISTQREESRHRRLTQNYGLAPCRMWV